MRNSISVIVVFALRGLWFLVPTVASEITEPPPRHYEEKYKKDFPCKKNYRQFLTRDRVFRHLDLSIEQREEIGRLKREFRGSLLDLRRRHNESLLNVLDDNQRQKLEEKKGEINRYLKDRVPYQQRKRDRPDGSPSKDDGIFNDLNILEVGVSRKSPETNIDPTTWGGVKKDFKE